MKKILCLGLTPALQRTLFFDTLAINEVNRAKQVLESAAGKALNTARALSTLGMPAKVTGLNGGTTGRTLETFLKAYGVTSVQTSMKRETRICTTLIDQSKGAITELVEEAPDPGRPTLMRFRRDTLNHLEQASALVISGTLPPFAPEDFYLPFVRAAGARDIPVIIDSHKAPLLHLLQERPLLVKLNVHELAITFKRKIKTERDIVECMNKLLTLGSRNVIITQGAKAAYLMTGSGALWRVLPPKLDQVVNPIGSGDCTTAGIVCKLLKRRPLPEALAFGLACGTANATTPTPADFDPKLATQFYQTIRKEFVGRRDATP
jgi:1-phosphofructokinase family hexose kinase